MNNIVPVYADFASLLFPHYGQDSSSKWLGYSQCDVSSSVTVSARVVERLCAPCCSMVPNISPSICRNEWTLHIIAIQIHRAYYCIHKQHCQTNATHLLPRDCQCFLIPLRVLIKEPFMFFLLVTPRFLIISKHDYVWSYRVLFGYICLHKVWVRLFFRYAIIIVINAWFSFRERSVSHRYLQGKPVPFSDVMGSARKNLNW